MSKTLEQLNAWAEAWADLMWAILWQSTLLIAVIAAIALLLRRSSPNVRYWLWQIVAVKLLLMPFWTLSIELPSWAGGPLLPDAVVAQPARPVAERPEGLAAPVPSGRAGGPVENRPAAAESPGWGLREIGWRSWLLIVWLAAVAWQFIRLLWQRVRLGRLLRGARAGDAELSALVGELAEESRLRRKPAVAVTDVACPLFVCGLRRPVLVLAGSLVASLDRARLRQALLHELAHVKRLDLLWSWPVEIARIFYFFHPLVHWVGYRLRLERELACDQLAMALSGGTPADYTNTLIDVVSHASRPAVLGGPDAISAGLDGNSMPPQHNRTSTQQSRKE